MYNNGHTRLNYQYKIQLFAILKSLDSTSQEIHLCTERASPVVTSITCIHWISNREHFTFNRCHSK